ncbi:hypothetical protein [Tenacibaculum dicentrarchi]|nr:conserved hypothetical protein [Tenacibaculum dicentrarchi]
MIQLINLPLVSWTYGTVIIVFFALVCVGLVATLLILIGTGKKKE